jgi:transposase-like protein
VPKALDPATRQAIEEAIRAGQTRNQIARDHSVSGSTVSKIGKELEAREGLGPAFERSQTKRARERRSDDLAARRTELAGLLMDDAFRLREKQWETQPQLMVVARRGGGAEVEVVQVAASSTDHRNYATAVGINVDKVRTLTDGADQTQKAVSLLERLMEHVDAE